MSTPKCVTVGITTNWKILKKMGIPAHLTSLLRYLCADEQTTVRIEHGTTDWFQMGKGVRQAYAEYIMRNAGLDEKYQ